MGVNRLVKIGGQRRLLPAGGVVRPVVSVDGPASTSEQVKYGHAAGYFDTAGQPNWSVFEAMFGKFDPNNNQMAFTCELGYQPTYWPNKTRMAWNVVPDPRQSHRINGYFHIDYGNYDDSYSTITPRQIKNVTAMTLNVDWTLVGNGASGMLSECWLSSASRPTGPAQYANELGYFSYVSPDVKSYVQSLPDLGTFTDASGASWRTADASSGSNQPYYMTYRTGYVDHHGPLHYKDYFTFLTGIGKLTGNEWFNGVAYGIEPTYGAGTLTINTIAATYTGN